MSASAVAPAANPILPARLQGDRLAFVPKDFDDAWRQASLLSQVGIFPDYLKGKPHDILATIITGAELGLSPMQSVRDIVVVKGKGFIQSKLKVALVKQATNKAAGEFFRMVSSTATSAVYETFREGEGLTRYEYTMEMAKLAGLHENDNYRKRPAEMLRARCSGDLAEIVWSDVTRGIGNKEDLPDAGAIALNSAPSTFAPPPPEKPEEAQVVPPTPPPPPAKTNASASPPRAHRLTIEDKPTLREPGADENEELQTPLVDTTPDDAEARQVLSEVNGVDTNDARASDTLDLLSPRAKKVNGPLRQQITDALKAKREALKKKAGK